MEIFEIVYITIIKGLVLILPMVWYVYPHIKRESGEITVEMGRVYLKKEKY